MFYNTYRTTKSSQQNRTNLAKNGAAVINPKERLINLQKREKLKGLLITKFMKKYGIKNPEKLLEDEITKFLQGEKLNDADLQRLDAKIHRLLMDKKAKDNLKSTLTKNLQQDTSAQPQPVNQEESIYPPQNQPKEEKKEPVKVPTPKQQPKPATSQCVTKGYKKYKSPEEELAELEAEEEAAKPHFERIDFSAEGDEWNAMAQYNKKLFEEEKINERIKDREVKRRTKEDLDNQVKQKLKREYEQSLRDKEYDKALLQHLKDLDEIEKKKKEALKQQVLREKANRDAQMKDEYTRKRLEILREKKFDRELIEHIKEDIEKDKQAAIEKKKKENEALQRTLKENELHKIKMAELAKKEREDDIRSCEEHAQTELKRENERIQYFKNIERNANNFMTGTAKKTLDDMERQNREEEEAMRKFNEERDRREQEEEDRKKLEEIENKKMMKKYLDMQVEEKKKMQQFEKLLDQEQARIWNTDCKKYFEDEKVINEKIRRMNKNNLDQVMNQIKIRKEKQKNQSKMTPTEYAMNRKTLEMAKAH